MELFHSEAHFTQSNSLFTIVAAVSGVDETTRRTTRLSLHINRALGKISAAADSAAYASVVVLSDHINSNYPSVAVRAQFSSDHNAAVQGQARAIATAVRAVDALDSCI